MDALPGDVARFHAQYRQAAPGKGWTDNWKNNWDDPVGDKKNLDGAGNYVFLEATGRGHFVGVTHSVEQNQDGWFGEGDDMIFIDGAAHFRPRGAHRRPLLPLPMAHRKPYHV